MKRMFLISISEPVKHLYNEEVVVRCVPVSTNIEFPIYGQTAVGSYVTNKTKEQRTKVVLELVSDVVEAQLDEQQEDVPPVEDKPVTSDLDVEQMRAIAELMIESFPEKTEIIQGVECTVASWKDIDYHNDVRKQFDKKFYPGACIKLLDRLTAAEDATANWEKLFKMLQGE